MSSPASQSCRVLGDPGVPYQFTSGLHSRHIIVLVGHCKAHMRLALPVFPSSPNLPMSLECIHQRCIWSIGACTGAILPLCGGSRTCSSMAAGRSLAFVCGLVFLFCIRIDDTIKRGRQFRHMTAPAKAVHLVQKLLTFLGIGSGQLLCATVRSQLARPFLRRLPAAAPSSRSS